MNASSYLLQAKSNDLFIVLDCFKLSITKLPELTTEYRFIKFVKEAKELCNILELDANKAEFKSVRVRLIKKMAMNNNKTKLQQIR